MKYFGTDGIRGVAHKELTVELAAKVGYALSVAYVGKSFVIGMDTRESSYALASALGNSIKYSATEVKSAGVVSTPMLSYYAKTKNMIGIMITASHNPYYDNGIKVFNEGKKLSQEEELKIEKIIDETKNITVINKKLEKVNIENTYLKMIKKIPFAGMFSECVFDCANGATSFIAPRVFVSGEAISNSPDGKNINEKCGSTYIENISSKIKGTNKFGFAFDGDGDRMIMVYKGMVLDGDIQIYLMAKYLSDINALSGSAVAITKMSNPGLIKALNKIGVSAVLTDVGDKHIISEMISSNLSLGGEASGHVITPYLHTGDGIISALLMMHIYDYYKEEKINNLIKDLVFYPMRTVNVYGVSKLLLKEPKVAEYIESVKNTLGDDSLLLVRPSGTEPVIRLTVSSKSEDVVNNTLENLQQYLLKEGKI